MTTEERVATERSRLMDVFATLDVNKLRTAQGLIDRAAFITVSLEELEKALNEKGFVEEYQNGENQRGLKKASEADLHISLTKNLNAIVKQLLELTPPAERSSRLDAMMRE